MITMEFEELQQIWDSQNNKPLYAINEEAMHNRILSKKRTGLHITNISELLIIIVNLGVGCFVFGVNFFSMQRGSIFMYLLVAWMLVTSLYMLIKRIRRIKGNNQFDRSIQGDLNHAISVATYQVRLSQLMRWNTLPVGIFIVLGFLELGKSFWLAVFILVAFALTHYASGWEHRIYKSRKRELEILKSKLEKKEQSDDLSSL